MADRPVLVCKAGPLRGQIIPVPEGGLEMGRAPDNDLVLDDEGRVAVPRATALRRRIAVAP